MKPIARLTTRMQGDGDGMIIGVALKDHNYFKPGTVYELVDVFGGLMLKEVGQATPAGDGETVADSPVRVHWSTEIGYIIAVVGKYLFLSRKEVADIVAEERKRNAHLD